MKGAIFKGRFGVVGNILFIYLLDGGGKYNIIIPGGKRMILTFCFDDLVFVN